ncbi:MAG: helix-turn-helix domain-containing protein [Proteobacteria bacterium]|nr:helix-turn-helix domain-containing protein [Pseudomonadota bacterium]
MDALHELGATVRARRIEMGLTQGRVASLSGLARQTINQVETGVCPDLGLNKADRLASVLGLVLRVQRDSQLGNARKMQPLARAAASASVSYKTAITESRLREIVLSAEVPANLTPHVHAFLDEASVSLLAAVADQLHAEVQMDRTVVWKNYRTLARQVKSLRDLWQ